MFISTLRYITRELFAEKTRIILTIFAIAWGTFAITSMLAIGEGLRVTFSKAVESVGKDLLTVTAGATAKTYRGIGANVALSLEKNDLDSIQHVPHLVVFSPQYDFTVKLYYKKQNSNAQIEAVDPIFGMVRNIELMHKGRFISTSDMQLRSSVIVLGNKTAATLFPHE